MSSTNHQPSKGGVTRPNYYVSRISNTDFSWHVSFTAVPSAPHYSQSNSLSSPARCYHNVCGKRILPNDSHQVPLAPLSAAQETLLLLDAWNHTPLPHPASIMWASPQVQALYGPQQNWRTNGCNHPMIFAKCRNTWEWQRGLRRRSAAERLLGSRVRIPLGAWLFILYSVCVVR
jgi:hypothetical protein